jgi:fimbrial chaperone protein
LCIAAPAYAGAFTVTPVRIYMTPRDKAVAVTITNESDEQLVMQADLYVWKQKPDGEDDLTLTDDMFLSPPIIKLAGKSHQVVRLARLNNAPSDRQLTYRMIVREIPEARPAKEKIQLQIALAFSMPVFITPKGAKSKLDCVVARTAADSINAVCENSGNAYAQTLNFELTDAAGEKLGSRDKGGYILPSIKRYFDIKSENNKAIPAGKAKLTIRLDDGSTQTFDVTVPG